MGGYLAIEEGVQVGEVGGGDGELEGEVRVWQFREEILGVGD